MAKHEIATPPPAAHRGSTGSAGDDRAPNQVAALRQLLAARDEELAAVRAERDGLQARSDARRAEIDKLRFLIPQLQRALYGRRSEKSDPEQLQLGLEDLEHELGGLDQRGDDRPALGAAVGTGEESNHVEPFAYLRDVLQQLVAGHTVNR